MKEMDRARKGVPQGKWSDKKILSAFRYVFGIFWVISGCLLLLSVSIILFDIPWTRPYFSPLNTAFVVCMLIEVVVRLAYNNFRTCPDCGLKVDYAFLQKEPGGELYCPHCRKAFRGKVIELDLNK